MISTLTLKNFKGLCASFALSAKTIVIGSNFSGKTGVIDGIRLAVLGYAPGQKSSRAGTMELASGKPMASEIFIAQENYGVTFGAKQAEDTQNLFTLPAAAIPLFDPSVFMGATNAERARQVALYLGADDKASVAAIVAKLKTAKGKKHGTAQEKALQAVLAKIEGDLAFSGSQAGAARIIAVDGILKAELSTVTANEKRMSATAAGTSKISGDADEMAALPSLASIDSELTLLNSERDKLIANLSVAVANHKRAAANFERLDVLRSESSAEERQTREKRVKELEAQIVTTKEGIATIDTKHAALKKSVDEREAAQKKRREEMDALMKASSPIFERMKNAGQWVGPGEFTIPGTDAEVEFRARGKVDADGRVIVSDFLSFLKKETVSEEEIEQAEKDAERADTISAHYETEAEELVEQHQELVSLRDALAEARETLETLNDDLQAARDDVRGLDEHGPEIERLTAETKGIDLEELQANVDRIETDKGGKEAAIEAKQATRRKVVEVLNDQQRIEQAVAESQRLAAEMEIIKAMQAKMKELRAEVIEGTIDEGLRVANLFAAGILKDRIQFDAGEITMGGIAFSVLSGVEQAITIMGMTVAIASKSPLKVVLLDELSIFDDNNKAKLVSNLCQLVDDSVIDQFVMADTRELAYPAEVTRIAV